MESSRVVDLSVLGRPSTQRGGRKMSRARYDPGMVPNKKVPSPSPPFMGHQPIPTRELPQYTPTPPQFEVGSQASAPQSRRTDRERMDPARTPVNEIGPFPWMQQSRMSTDGWMRSVSPPSAIEGAIPDSTHGSQANDEDVYFPEVSTTRLYLGNLPPQTTKQHIAEHFSTHGTGTITEIKLMNGFGFITFDDAMDARDIVLACHGSEFMGSRLRVQFDHGWRLTENVSGAVKAASPGNTVGTTSFSSTRFYLGNLPRHATKQDIENHFSAYGTGTITEIKVMSGFGFIEYEDAMDARDIVAAFHGSDFMGSRLTVQSARGRRPTESVSGAVKAASPGNTVGTISLSPTRLYLGNLPLHATKPDIENHFSTHGTGRITEIKLMTGFGFIEYDDAMVARNIVDVFHGSDFMGSRLTVNFARGPRQTESKPRGQARLVREEGAGEADSPQQVSEQDRMPRDFEMQTQTPREQQSRRHDLLFQQQQKQHLKRFAIKGNVNPEQTPNMPPRFQKLRNHDDDGDVRNTGAENETSGSSGKRSKTLKKHMSKNDFQLDIVTSINDDAGSMSGKNTAMSAAALGSAGRNNTMFICYTISEDRTGSQENVTRQRLSTLGAQCRKRKIPEFSHSLA